MANLPPEPPPDEITPEDVYLRRREFIRNAALAVGGAAVLGGGLVALTRGRGAPEEVAQAPEIPSGARQDFANGEELTAYSGITGYNNFYEFGVDKTDPARFAHMLKPKPWAVEIAGEVGKPGVYDLDDLIGGIPLEDRVYRMRCVEAWSMVIPWLGFPLASLLAKVEPTAAAKYVAFTTLLDPEQMPGQKWGVLDWPYVEGLRIDEAMHPLTLIAIGIYGKALLGQNGAPLRLVVPWKYGFKGIKSIVRIALVREQPPTTWNIAAPDEYGFYANVNPEVDHPRWSQASERRIGELIRRPTLPFNGYADAVAGLYTGLDLRVNF